MNRRGKIIMVVIFVTLLVGFTGVMGYRLGVYLSIDTLGGMVEKMDQCCMPTLDYAMEENNDCRILITGKMQECYYNETEVIE